MKLYFLTEAKQYVHRQADVPKGADFEVRDIPTDLQGLMGHLNFLHKELASWKDLAERSPEQFDKEILARDAVQEEQENIPAAPRTIGGYQPAPGGELGSPPTSGTVVQKPVHVVQMDVQLDVEDAIHKATPRQLASYSHALCWRIKELSDGCV